MNNFYCLIFLIMIGCVSTAPHEIFTSKKSGKEYIITAKINGMDLSADIILNGKIVMNQTWPPFVNSRNQKIVNVNGDEVKSVLKIIKGRGTGIIMNVSINDEPAAEFVF